MWNFDTQGKRVMRGGFLSHFPVLSVSAVGDGIILHPQNSKPSPAEQRLLARCKELAI